MLKIYRLREGKMEFLKKPVKNCWIELREPTEEELDFLAPYIEITQEVVDSVKDKEEVPKLEVMDDYNFLLLQTPISMQGDTFHYRTVPLGIIYNSNYLVTLVDGRNDVLDYLKTKLLNLANNHIVTSDRFPQFILKLMLFNSKLYLRALKALTNAFKKNEDQVALNPTNEDIVAMMDYEKSMSYFNVYLQSNHLVYQKITKKTQFTSKEDDADLCEDILDENLQAVEAVKIHGKILHSTISSFNSIISNKLNESVKFLTTFSIVLMMPTLVASVYGMNVSLPLQQEVHAFWLIVGMSFFLTLGLVLFFFRKKLF